MMTENDIMDVSGAVQGKVSGLIIPPPDIRAVIDKTATFVARNGTSFEQKILNSAEGKTAKFNFMRQYDPYHAYYEYKIREVEEGREPLVPEKIIQAKQQEAPKASTVIASTKASFVSPIARLTSNKPTEPSPFEFSTVHPNGITASDFDIMRLTAQYTAVNGRDFLAGIAQREQRNPQFDFLKPTHMLFHYFTSLVDAYSKILLPSAETINRIQSNSSSAKVLQNAVNRWDWNRIENEKKKNNEQAVDEERKAYQSIDWFDFTVVETIDFAEDELLDGSNMRQLQPPSINVNQYPSTASTMMMTAPPPPAMRPIATTASTVDQDADMDMDMDDDDGDLKIVHDYIPRTAQSSNATMMMVDPISGKSIPADKMEDHMRIQLIDPSWKVQQKRFQDKQQETGYAEGSSIADSLKLFAKKRNDIFGSENTPKTENDYAQQEEVSSVQWDGHHSSIAMTMQMRSELGAKLPETHTTPHNSVGPQPSYQFQSTAPPAAASYSQLSYTAAPPPPPPQPQTSYHMTAPPPMNMMPMQPPVSATPWMGYTATSTLQPPSFPPPPPAFPGFTPATTTPEVETNEGADNGMVPEEEFASMYPDPITITVIVPTDSSTAASNWNLHGQTISITSAMLSSCKELKEQLSPQLGDMPVNKQQLKLRLGSAAGGGWFLKDTSSLAAMNVGDGAIIELSVRSRGGKK